MKKYKITIVFLSLAVLVLSTTLIFLSMSDQSNDEESQWEKKYAKLEEDYYTLDASLISLNDLNVHLAKELELFRNSDHRIFHLLSDNAVLKETKAILCWNKKDGTILLSVENLPELSDKTRWELWAVVQGKPTFLGPLPNTLNGNFILIDYSILKAENFLISLENTGENKKSTPSNTYLSGNL